MSIYWYEVVLLITIIDLLIIQLQWFDAQAMVYRMQVFLSESKLKRVEKMLGGLQLFISFRDSVKRG
jgi:hypothetical protein